jgi:hypothetical protein
MTKQTQQQIASLADMCLFWCRHDVTGEDEICVVVSQRQYFELKKGRSSGAKPSAHSWIASSPKNAPTTSSTPVMLQLNRIEL